MSNTNGHASRSEIFASTNVRRYHDVTIDGKTICLASWTEREMGRFNSDNRQKANRDTANVRMIVKTCVDSTTHEPIFTDEDVDQIRDLDAGFVVSLTAACMDHCRFTDIDEEDAEKN